MLDPRRLSIHQVTLLQQCSTPQFVAALARNGVPCTSLWRDKTREYGVEKTARLDRRQRHRAVGLLFRRPDHVARIRARPPRPATRFAARSTRPPRVKAPCVVFVAGGIDPRDKNIADARARALDGVADLIPHARSVGVKIALEPLHPMICATRSVLSTVKLANDWCDRLGAEDIVGIAVDTYAVWWDPEIETEIARAGKRICSFHVSDWLADTQDLRLDRGMMGDGVIDLPALRRMVEAAGYDGYVEVEIFSQRNWWQRDPDEVIGVIKDRVQTAV